MSTSIKFRETSLGENIMKISIRTIVIFAMLAIVFGGVTMAFVSEKNANYAAKVSPEIEGTWLATITPSDGMPPFPSLLTFASGGALTVTDGGVSPALGNLYQGTWAKIGPHKYAFTFWGFVYDETGVLTNYFISHDTIQVEPGGKTYNGVSAGELIDLDQNVVMTMTGTSHATRINAK
jgi:hypothetical protein